MIIINNHAPFLITIGYNGLFLVEPIPMPTLIHVIFLLYSVIFSASLAHAESATTLNKLHVKKVLLVIAMDSEAKPIISTLNLHKVDHSFSKLPMQSYRGKYNKLDILLIMNGMDPINHVQNVGTQAATLSTYVGAEYFHPDLIISIGTAGGVEQNGTKLRDIYVSQKIYFYDRRLAIKGYHEYALGGYQSVSLSPLDKKIGLKPGIVCSGDSFDDNQTDYNMFIKENCSAIDMEAAGVAWVSMLMQTPMFAMKGITNFVKGNNIHEQYQKNLPIVTSALADKLRELLKNLSW